jgi:hypothetical protein
VDLEQRPLVGFQHLVRQLLAHVLKPGVDDPRLQPAQIQPLDPVGWRLRQHLLLTVRQDHRPQHVVPLDHPLPRRVETLQVQASALKFQVNMCGDIP